jgi:hypothetical protein
MNAFNFNGSFIDCIEESNIKEKLFDDDKRLNRIQLVNNSYLNVYPFNNEFPLILDSVKRYFNVFPTLYNVGIIDNKKYLLSPYKNDISLEEYVTYRRTAKNESNIHDIRNIFVFNWIMCVKNSYDIYVRPFSSVDFLDTKKCDSVIFFSKGEKTFHYFEEKSDVPKLIISEWFDKSVELFYEYAINMIKNIDCDKFRFEITKIILGYKNQEYLSWLNVVYNRIRNIHQMSRD